jgi:FkbM family methyltransferase
MKKLFASLLKDQKTTAKSDEPFLAQQYLFENSEPLIIFDVGAYIGEISKIYKEIFPSATIYSFEPFPDSFRKLEELSADQRIKPFQLAVSDHAGKTRLYINADVTCNSFFPRPKNGAHYYPEKAEHIDQIEVDTATIDNICERENIEKIDILKLDVEGAEIRALGGACDKLSKHAISLIYIEVMFTAHYEGGCLYHELADFLEKYDYTLFNLYNLKRAKNGQLRWGNAIFLSPEKRAQIEAT